MLLNMMPESMMAIAMLCFLFLARPTTVATQQELHEPPEGCMLLNMMPESMMAIATLCFLFLARPTTRQDCLNFTNPSPREI
jgi:hypothetical protein